MGFFKNKIFSPVTILVGLILASPLVHATYPDLTAAPWNGSFSGSDFDCTNSADDGPFTDPGSIVFSNQVGGNFDVVVTFVEESGTEVDTGTGMFLSENTIQFIVSNNDFGTDNTVVNGTISGNTMSLTFNGGNSGGDYCHWSGTGSVSQAGGNVITPVITPGSTVTDAILLNIQMQDTVRGISSHTGDALHGIRSSFKPRITDNQFKIGGATGLNAGDGTTTPYGVWGSYSYSDYDNDLSSTAFDGDTHSFLGGIDFGFWENTVMGVAFGYDNGDIDTTFNGGQQDFDTYTIAPYFGALLTDTLSLDFNIGYSYVDYDQFRTLPGTTTRVSSSPDADRWFGALNLNGITYRNNWILGGRIGALFGKSVIDSYTESNGTVVAESRTKVGTGVIAGDVAYSYKNYEPFVNLSYQYDFKLRELSVTTGPQPENDRDDILVSAGVRYYNDNGISGNLEYTKRFERDNFDEDRISLTIRGDF